MLFSLLAVRAFLTPRRLCRLLTAGVCLTTASAAAQAPALQWDKNLGGNDIEFLRGLQPTPDGGYLVGGTSYSGVSGDRTQASRGQADFWLVKLDAQGQKQWDKAYGGSAADDLFVLCPTSDGGYLLGGISFSGISGDRTQASRGQGDYWVVKIDAQGVMQWDARYGGNNNDYLYAVQQTSDGGYILAGESGSILIGDKTQGNQGFTDYWVVKIDANGTKQWDKTFGGPDTDQLRCVQQTPDGGYLLAGSSLSGLGGDKTDGRRGNAANYDWWVVKIDAVGTKQWDKTFGGSESDVLYGMQLTSDGGSILAGRSASGAGFDKSQPNRGAGLTTDAWVVKLDALGQKQWDKTFGGSADDEALAVRQLADGSYLVAGSAASGISGDKTQASRGLSDYWLLKTDATGTKQWDARYGGSNNDYVFSLVVHPDGSLALGGSSYSGVGGDKTQASQGQADYWLVRLSAGPTATVAATARQPLAVYPNPTQSRVTVRLPDEAPRTGLTLTLLDATGRAVWRQPLGAAAVETPVEVGPQPAGLYLLRLDGPSGYRAAQRLVFE